MNLNINLLKNNQLLSPALLSALKFLRRFSLISLVIFILVVTTVFSIYFSFRSETDKIRTRLDQAVNFIKSQKTTEGSYLNYFHRLASVEKLINNRFTPAETIRKIKRLIPEEVIISSLNLDQQTISFKIEFPSLEMVDYVIKNLQNQEELPIREFTLSGFGKDILNGHYQADISIILSE